MTTIDPPALAEIIKMIKDGTTPAAAINLRLRGVKPPALIHYFIAGVPEISLLPDYLPGLIYRDRARQVFEEARQKSVSKEAVLSDIAAYLFHPALRRAWAPIYTHAVCATLKHHKLPDSCRQDFLVAPDADGSLTAPQKKTLSVLRIQMRSRLVREARVRLIGSYKNHWVVWPTAPGNSFRGMVLRRLAREGRR